MPLFIFAQENVCHYKVNKISKVLKSRILKTDWILLKKNKNLELFFSLNRTGNQKYVVFKLNKNLGCTTNYDPKSFARITLSNEEILKLKHFGDTNCNSFYLQGRLEKEVVKKLKGFKIKSIVLSGTKNNYYINYIENSNMFIKNLSCID